MIRRRSFFREWFKTKAPLQGFALLIALVAWVVVNSGQTIQQRRNIRLQYLQLPKNLVFQRTPLKEFKVDLTGSLYQLRMIPDDDLVYPIDLSNAKEGVARIDLDVDSLRLPVDVEATRLNPRSFNIHLEEVHAKMIPLKPVLIGKPKDGFQVGKIKLTPASISAMGPKSILANLLETEIEISVIDRDSSFSDTIKPRLKFPSVEALDSVLVEVEIGPQSSKQEFQSIPVAVLNESRKTRISPEFARVVLEGSEGELRNLQSKLKVLVSVEGLKRGRYRLRGQLNLSQKIKVISIEPESFLVEVLQ